MRLVKKVCVPLSLLHGNKRNTNMRKWKAHRKHTHNSTNFDGRSRTLLGWNSRLKKTSAINIIMYGNRAENVVLIFPLCIHSIYFNIKNVSHLLHVRFLFLVICFHVFFIFWHTLTSLFFLSCCSNFIST